MALMRQLQASLSGSRTALLTLDLGAIEQGTREQVELSRRLAEDPRQASPGAGRVTLGADEDHALRVTAGFQELEATLLEAALREELERSEREVLQALRLQSALLERARRKLRVLSNMLAGPGVDYVAPLYAAPLSAAPLSAASRRSGALPQAFYSRTGGRGEPCRA